MALCQEGSLSQQAPWLKVTCLVVLAGGLPLGVVGARTTLVLDHHRHLNTLPLSPSQQASVFDALTEASPTRRAEVESFAMATVTTETGITDDLALARLYAGAFNAAARFASLPDHARVVRSRSSLWGLELGIMAWVTVPETHNTKPMSISPRLAIAGLRGDVSGNVIGHH
jgi:hypothetical protein